LRNPLDSIDAIGRGRVFKLVYDKQFAFILSCETLLRYRKEVFNGHYLANGLRDSIARVGPSIQAPKRYLEYVLAKTDPVSYKKSQKLIANFILSHTVLCTDCIRHVVSFI